MIFEKNSIICMLFIVKILIADKNNKNTKRSEYMGENFPTKYLVSDKIIPTVSMLDHYLDKLTLTVEYFSFKPNNSDVNVALGLFFMKSLLKRTLRDYGHKIKWYQRISIDHLIRNSDIITSHYIYNNAAYGWEDIEFRVSRLFKDDSSLVHSIHEFNRNRLINWILDKDNKINDFTEDMDNATFPKDKYVECVESVAFSDYYIRVQDSDTCISRVATNPEPIDVTELKPCRPDAYCRQRIRSSPSVAYTLSHRLLNVFLYNNIRRCFLYGETKDNELMDLLCAGMYREAVYIARRGFFVRDLFMEHIALCGMLGYQEFHRRNWFRKVTTWIDEEGCVAEARNFELNRTRFLIQRAGDNIKIIKQHRKLLKKALDEDCHHHPMALAVIVLAHAIRHALHFM